MKQVVFLGEIKISGVRERRDPEAKLEGNRDQELEQPGTGSGTLGKPLRQRQMVVRAYVACILRPSAPEAPWGCGVRGMGGPGEPELHLESG